MNFPTGRTALRKFARQLRHDERPAQILFAILSCNSVLRHFAGVFYRRSYNVYNPLKLKTARNQSPLFLFAKNAVIKFDVFTNSMPV